MGTRVRISRDFWVGLFAVVVVAAIGAAFAGLPFVHRGDDALMMMVLAFPVLFVLLLREPLRELHAVWRATRWESEK